MKYEFILCLQFFTSHISIIGNFELTREAERY
jgi:hypothetical protein